MSTSTSRIVSSDAEQLILVDVDDKELGYLGKADCHDGSGILHRAFSLFLFDENGRLLLQKRSAGKRLWPGFWSNSCCSHPRKGESMEIATRRRLMDELNITADIEFVYKFEYQATYKDDGSENELCSVYLGKTDDVVTANETEIEEWRFVDAAELDSELRDSPGIFTPWFKLEWRSLTGLHADKLAGYI